MKFIVTQTIQEELQFCLISVNFQEQPLRSKLGTYKNKNLRVVRYHGNGKFQEIETPQAS